MCIFIVARKCKEESQEAKNLLGDSSFNDCSSEVVEQNKRVQKV